MGEYLLGIDIGTSACKIAVFAKDGTVKATGTGDYQVYYPHPGWAEQNPEEWWEAVCDAIPRVLVKGNISPEEIKGIGIDGQSWSAIAVDKDGNVLTNTPIWMDTRATDICEEFNEKIGKDKIFELCGNSLQPSYTTAKIIWYQRNLPEVYAKTYKILQSNSYIAYKLTGVMTQDLSQGYGLHCFDMRTGTWNEEMCQEFGFSSELLPEIHACHEVIGEVNEKAAKESGLAEGTPVGAGGLDALAHDGAARQVRAGAQDDGLRLQHRAGAQYHCLHVAAFAPQLRHLRLPQRQVLLLLQRLLHHLLVLPAVCLRPQRPHRRAFAPVQHTVLDAGLVRRLGHFAAQSVQLPHQVALACAANGRVARHIPHRVQADGQTHGPHAHPRRRQRRLDSGVSRAYHRHVERAAEKLSHAGSPTLLNLS